MVRYIFVATCFGAMCMLAPVGYSVLQRVDNTISQLTTANEQLITASAQLSMANRQLADMQFQLGEANRQLVGAEQEA